MTLNFSTHWGPDMGMIAGKPTYFVHKIWNGLVKEHLYDVFDERHMHKEYFIKFEERMHFRSHLHPKIHTIRRGNRWKRGDKIHMVIHNRTENRFQFAPMLKCTGVQDFEIKYTFEVDHLGEGVMKPHMFIDGIKLSFGQISRLAINDGFDRVQDFYKFFCNDFKGQIIHWVDGMY